jgi:hypothetical protein
VLIYDRYQVPGAQYQQRPLYEKNEREGTSPTGAASTTITAA